MAGRKSQFAMEFVVLIAFMLVIFLGFFAVVSMRILEAKENENKQIAKEIANMVQDEVTLANSVADGYKRTFNVQQKFKGSSYNIAVIGNRELVVNYLGNEQVVFLPERVCGDAFKSENEIDKKERFICLNSNLNFTQCQNAQNLNLCDEIDEELLPGVKCCCCGRYGLCC